jgi:hypothetical protein
MRSVLNAGLPITLTLSAMVTAGHAQESLYRTELPAEAQVLTGPEGAERFFNWGVFKLRPQATVSAAYDDNVTLRPRDELDDFFFALTPGVVLGVGDLQQQLGNLVLVRYTPSYLAFLEHDEFNALNQEAAFAGQLQTPKLTVRLDQTYQDLEGGVKEVGDWAERQLNLTRLTSRYAYSEKTAFGINGRQSMNHWEDLTSYNEWAVEGFADYSLSPKLTTGLGTGALWRDAEDSPNLVAEQVLARASYYLSGKILLNASAGLEFRQFQGGVEQGPGLIYLLSGAYRPLENTTLTLQSYRRDQVSIDPVFFGQNLITTGVTIGARQRFLEKYTAGVSAGYENADYEAVQENVRATREDDYFLVNGLLEANFTEKWTAGIYYQFRINESSLPADRYDFDNHQIGVRTTYKF